MLQYTILPWSLDHHEWQITLQFNQHHADVINFSLPNWVPGSYMIREFARHIIEINAYFNDKPVKLTQTSKNTWQLAADVGVYCIRYRVYAFDLSVRGAWLSRERGFFDGACVFLRHNQRQQEACLVRIDTPPAWQLATSLPKADAPHTFMAADYRDLIDHPVEMGALTRLSFEACGIAHEIVISGHSGVWDTQRLQEDVQRICQTQLAFFPRPAPFERYVFLLHVGDHIYGGLEHGSSTALLADRHSLPRLNQPMHHDYIQLLGLFSHEYFHAWNVKSITAQAFADSDLNQEAYSEELWAFEGITSYYDDLFLVRSGVIDEGQYLQLLAENLTRVQQGSGRSVQTLAQASFNAWSKYYKQNENSPNVLVSYYQQGALMALCLDAHLRCKSQGQCSLDTLMQTLYQDYTRSGEALAEGAWQARAQAISGLDLSDFFAATLHSTADLPLVEALAVFGVDLQWYALPRSHGGAFLPSHQPLPQSGDVADLGARWRTQPGGVRLTHVLHHGAASQAGLCAGDDLVALDRLAITDFAAQWQRIDVGQTLSVHYFRHGVLYETKLIALPAHADTALLRISSPRECQLWLGHPN